MLELLHGKQKKLLDDPGFENVSIDNTAEAKAICKMHLREMIIVQHDVDHVDYQNALLPAKESVWSEDLI